MSWILAVMISASCVLISTVASPDDCRNEQDLEQKHESILKTLGDGDKKLLRLYLQIMPKVWSDYKKRNYSDEDIFIYVGKKYLGMQGEVSEKDEANRALTILNWSMSLESLPQLEKALNKFNGMFESYVKCSGVKQLPYFDHIDPNRDILLSKSKMLWFLASKFPIVAKFIKENNRQWSEAHWPEE